MGSSEHDDRNFGLHKMQAMRLSKAYSISFSQLRTLHRITNIVIKLSSVTYQYVEWPRTFKACGNVVIVLENDQRDAHLLYFTIYLLWSSTCFEHCMLIIRRLNYIYAASGIVLSMSDRSVHRLGKNSPNLCTGRTDCEDDTRCCINAIQPPDDEHTVFETCRGM